MRPASTSASASWPAPRRTGCRRLRLPLLPSEAGLELARWRWCQCLLAADRPSGVLRAIRPLDPAGPLDYLTIPNRLSLPLRSNPVSGFLPVPWFTDCLRYLDGSLDDGLEPAIGCLAGLFPGRGSVAFHLAGAPRSRCPPTVDVSCCRILRPFVQGSRGGRSCS